MAARGSGPGGLAERYAAALFELADEKQDLDRVAGDLQALKAMVAGSADLQRLLRSPCSPARSRAVRSRPSSRRSGAGELTRRFVGLVAHNRRLFVLGAMIEAFLAELAAPARRGQRRGGLGAWRSTTASARR